MGFPQARVADLHTCTFLAPPPAPPAPVPAPMPILPPCCPTVLVGKMPAARIFDMATPAFPHPIIKGSATVLIGKMPAARVMDTCACGGPIVKGEFTVLVGG
ncbi:MULTISPECIES: PAAR domain-containing protein [Ruegeria]|uniref:PAAR domain-containing protein n=1 Tax=Ruegeria TaxID=97050 RepID=UPI0014799BA2|nr:MULTISPECIES: PAAR domain-containing protein [Ruegeria]MBO9413470.1 PAAR domain-containing protein [Ruegeria sp. R8_1]MBO9417347.1 PAAR domain-containing protein [Ruegeria sp. R8_2]